MSSGAGLCIVGARLGFLHDLCSSLDYCKLYDHLHGGRNNNTLIRSRKRRVCLGLRVRTVDGKSLLLVLHDKRSIHIYIISAHQSSYK